MWRHGLIAAAAIAAMAAPAGAQSFNPFGDTQVTKSFQDAVRSNASRPRVEAAPVQPRGALAEGRSRLAAPGASYAPPPPQQSPAVLDGGSRPSISPMSPSAVPFRGPYSPGQIVIDTSGRQLLLVQSGGMALRYPISVGRDGFTWTGTQSISRVASWPDWHPPAEMRQRDPRLPEKMTGGVRNPLGAKALYLGSSLYRIHGTNDATTIGQAASSGCFRMMNGHVIDLANRVGVGTTVTVVGRLPSSAFAEGAPGAGRRPG